MQALVAQAEQTAPAGTLAVTRAAEKWLELGRADAALELVERALARRPDALALTVLRARARVAAGPEDAPLRAAQIGELVALADRHRADPEALAQLVDGLQQLGATEAAQAIHDDVRQRFPDARAVERWDWQLAAVFGAVGTCRMALADGKLPPADALAQARAPSMRSSTGRGCATCRCAVRLRRRRSSLCSAIRERRCSGSKQWRGPCSRRRSGRRMTPRLRCSWRIVAATSSWHARWPSGPSRSRTIRLPASL
ncbi:tetratricopeptide repeat protein [Nannocystis pusilla]|uniref:tetratricopeptide repeat protein n=1 Tax=Nannocystis pusilla TaxID=889268 RepID=UPI003B8268F2